MTQSPRLPPGLIPFLPCPSPSLYLSPVATVTQETPNKLLFCSNTVDQPVGGGQGVVSAAGLGGVAAERCLRFQRENLIFYAWV